MDKKKSKHGSRSLFARSFAVDEFGITDNCLGVGTGGGATQRYDDLILYPTGEIHAIQFVLPSAPDDYKRKPRGTIEALHYESLARILERLSFYDTEPAASSTYARYVFAALPGKRVHAVPWASEEPTHPTNPLIGTLHLLLSALDSLLVFGASSNAPERRS